MAFSNYLGLSVNSTSKSHKCTIDNNKNKVDYFFDYPLEVALPPICNSAEVKYLSYLGFSRQIKKETRPVITQKNKYRIDSSNDVTETLNNMLIIQEVGFFHNLNNLNLIDD
ncbi:hypothetical protein F8M41_026398 [Gigaspora margarita]|uniref:Uncharacterized protein n=1 Tax=Gigaspora margarita TaxID=4874 RepID=A0A8H4A918_GIGMA|nr:hypothetical protein F8M41_026398 [Gigaspora margarita]